MTTKRPDSALERLLLALEDELLQATDEEVLTAAHELGMNPAMKGSAAFFGVTRLARMRGLPQTTARKDLSLAPRRPKGGAPRSS